MSIITLLTDFGLNDEYVGTMKGVIFSVNPSAVLVDITHNIDPHDIIQAAFTIKASYKFFPKGTVHVVIVDPGVGGSRAIIALETAGHIFIAPDNGILTLLVEENNIAEIIRVDNKKFFLEPVSLTFHGRDIFAPVSAHISSGIKIDNIGTPINKTDLVKLSIPKPGISDKGELVGTIVSIDRFGNLITNIDSNCLENFCRPNAGKKPEIRINNNKISGLSESYENSALNSPLVIIGSRGYLEIAVNCYSAKKYFKAEKGNTITVSIDMKI
ncbi:MAG: SAM-dependent chlorinase/fluorinase [Deltaproteobacteria bacterium]|nr:SAM-dependent chlorinase/fluorinase [Deltaproteobacteria bacterium]